MKLTLKNLSMAIMMSGMIMGSSAMAADSNEKNSHRPSRCQWIFAGAYAASKSDGVCAGSGLSGTGFGDDEGRPSGCPA